MISEYEAGITKQTQFCELLLFIDKQEYSFKICILSTLFKENLFLIILLIYYNKGRNFIQQYSWPFLL